MKRPFRYSEELAETPGTPPSSFPFQRRAVPTSSMCVDVVGREEAYSGNSVWLPYTTG